MKTRATLPAARSLAKRATAVVLIWALQLGQAAQASDLSQQMANMFGNGTLANVTGPGAYKAQTQNIYIGGEMQLRFPARSYQLWSYSLPSGPRFGCGGADIFLGSFSHINSDQFKQMLEEVARAYVALTFKAALKSINPLIESVIGDLQKTLESFSQYNASACTWAQAAVDATSAVTGMTAENTCISGAMKFFGDSVSQASVRCKAGISETNNALKASGNLALREMADRDINLIWDALSASTLSAAEKEVFMNVAGTVIIYKPANANNEQSSMPKPFEPSVDSLNTLLHGTEPGASDAQVRIANWLKCPDADCLAPTRETVSVTPFPVLVRQMLESIRDRVYNREALTAAEIKFMNMTRVPVYRLIAMGYTSDSSSGTQDLVDVLINRYAKVIAYDYAYTFMRVALKDARLYLGMAKLRTRIEQEQRDRMLDNVNRLLEDIDREHAKELGRVREARSVIEDMQGIERDMRLSLPTSLRNMQDIGNLMRGGRG
jgi:conjugative transfer pilus assembly protein TraH